MVAYLRVTYIGANYLTLHSVTVGGAPGKSLSTVPMTSRFSKTRNKSKNCVPPTLKMLLTSRRAFTPTPTFKGNFANNFRPSLLLRASFRLGARGKLPSRVPPSAQKLLMTWLTRKLFYIYSYPVKSFQLTPYNRLDAARVNFTTF